MKNKNGFNDNLMAKSSETIDLIHNYNEYIDTMGGKSGAESTLVWYTNRTINL